MAGTIVKAKLITKNARHLGVLVSILSQSLAFDQFPEHPCGASLFWPQLFEVFGQIVCQFHGQVTLGHIAVVVGDIHGQMGLYFIEAMRWIENLYA